MRFNVEDQVAEGDKVVTRWSVEATQSGEFLGMPPSGKTVNVTGINIFRIVDGYFVEGWHNLDTLRLLQQLGVVPTH
jgi:predicted ester cyclase